MIDFWARMDDLHRRWDVLAHPFYVRWSRGELSRTELAHYAGQYRHAVVALADASTRVATLAAPHERATLEAHAEEERAHVALWDDFAGAVGVAAPAAPQAETRACVQAWAGAGAQAGGHLSVLHAIESAQPAVARTKGVGLRERYGFTTGPATAYFDVHAERDADHARDARMLLEPRLAAASDADRQAWLDAAGSALAGNWALLDGVERSSERV